jgi:hypothetical protein
MPITKENVPHKGVADQASRTLSWVRGCGRVAHILLYNNSNNIEWRDPFILLLIAQSWEKTGDAMRAKEYYGKVMADSGRGPTNALARPVARKKLAGG